MTLWHPTHPPLTSTGWLFCCTVLSPTGLQFMKRSGPKGSVGLGFSYDSNLLKTIDVNFLVDVKTLVEAMTGQDPSLQRVDAKYATQ